MEQHSSAPFTHDPTRRRFLGLVGAGALATGASLVVPAPAVAAPPPGTVPGLRSWVQGSGSFSFTTGSRVVALNGLVGVAERLASDLSVVVDRPVRVVTGGARTGDVVLKLGEPDTALGAEGYRLVVGDRCTVGARSSTGARWGTRSLLQMLHQTRVLPAGTGRDWPSFGRRSLMVDVARKFYSMAWLEARVREMSYLKLNHLRLHLSDDQAFRLESDTVPEAVSAEFYTKQEIEELVDYAALFGVVVVPEIDMPGHMSAILATRPELSLRKPNGNLSLDLAQHAAWDLAEALLEEYLPLFPAASWHLGADEWLSNAELGAFPHLADEGRARFGPDATGRDLQYAFINRMNDVVHGAGKAMWIWNDQLVPGRVVQVDPSVGIEHWFGADEPTVAQLAGQGHFLVTANWNRLYYIIGGGRPDPAYLYETFRAEQFALGGGSIAVDVGSSLRGAQLSIWGEPGRDEPEESVAANVAPSLRSLAQNLWGSPRPHSTYAGFQTLTGAIGEPPDA